MEKGGVRILWTRAFTNLKGKGPQHLEIKVYEIKKEASTSLKRGFGAGGGL